MRNFPTTLALTALSMIDICNGQLPQECFLHSTAHGGNSKNQRYVTEYMSDLPLLQMNYDPLMKLKSITGFVKNDGVLTGVQLEHTNDTYSEKLVLEKIGGISSSQQKLQMMDEALNFISIVYN